MLEVVDDEFKGGGIFTTEYEGHKEIDGKLEIYTYNSIYVCEVVKSQIKARVNERKIN